MLILGLYNKKQNSLTAQLDSDKVFNSQVFEEHAARGWGLEKEGNISTELPVERGEVQVRRLLIEVGCVPEVIWKEKAISKAPDHREPQKPLVIIRAVAQYGDDFEQ